MDDFKEGEVEDLATLARLDEKVLLNELKVRYNKNRIYVSNTSKHQNGRTCSGLNHGKSYVTPIIYLH